MLFYTNVFNFFQTIKILQLIIVEGERIRIFDKNIEKTG